MKKAQMEVLNVTQQVLRIAMVSLAASCKADASVLAQALEGAATQRTLDPMAREMLADLASGITLISAANIRKQ